VQVEGLSTAGGAACALGRRAEGGGRSSFEPDPDPKPSANPNPPPTLGQIAGWMAEGGDGQPAVLGQQHHFNR
jgi:hypothetical protein